MKKITHYLLIESITIFENHNLAAYLLGLMCILIFLLYLRSRRKFEVYKQKLKKQEMGERVHFFMNLAHEIKTPLTLLRSSFSSCFKKVPPSDEADSILYNLDSLIRYVSAFFTLENLERGEIIYDHTGSICLNTICEKITAQAEPACEEKDISIWFDGTSEGMYVRIDPDALNTILYNLLQNAIKYTENGGQVEVALNEIEGKVQLIVRDSGVGIDPEKLDDIYKPFVRLMKDKSTVEGLGLGMAIVKKIVDQVGAGIDVRSTPGKGTEWSILFEKSEPGSLDSQDTYPASGPVRVRKALHFKKVRHNKKKPTILIVDDEHDVLCCIQDLFLEAGYNAYTAENGKDALQKLELLPRPDVIVADFVMHPMNGHVLLDTICSNLNPLINSIPFILLSAHSNDSDVIDGFEKGAVAYMSKPFDSQKLVARVSAIVDYTRRKEKAVRKENSKIANEIKDIPIDDNKCLEYGISKRQKTVLCFKHQGLTYNDIGKNMGITEGAVKAHFNAIKKKTKMHDIDLIIRLFFYDS